MENLLLVLWAAAISLRIEEFDHMCPYSSTYAGSDETFAQATKDIRFYMDSPRKFVLAHEKAFGVVMQTALKRVWNYHTAQELIKALWYSKNTPIGRRILGEQILNLSDPRNRWVNQDPTDPEGAAYIELKDEPSSCFICRYRGLDWVFYVDVLNRARKIVGQDATHY